jgi:hypothetical protein
MAASHGSRELAGTGVPLQQLTVKLTKGVFLGCGVDRVADELRARKLTEIWSSAPQWRKIG